VKPDASEAEFNNAVAKQNPNLTERILKEQALPAERVRVAAAYKKLAAQFKADAKPTDEALKRSLSDTTVRHILIKFGPGALPEAQARAKAQKILEEVKATPAKFADLAKKESEDPGSKAKGGEYTWGPEERKNIVPEFSAALEKLQPGQTYPEVVRHEGGYNGFHIIRLESVKQGKDFPKDFDKEKAKYAEQYAEQFVQQRMQAAITSALPGIKVEVSDPGLKAEELLQAAGSASDPKEREAKFDEAIAQLSKIDPKDDALGTVPVRKARIFEQRNKPVEAIAAYEEALKSRNSPETRMALARLYLSQKDKEKAKAQLDEAAKLAISSPMSYMQLSSMYQEAGDAAKAKAASDKANVLFKRIQDSQQAQMPVTVPPTAAGSPAPGASPAAPAPAPSK